MNINALLSIKNTLKYLSITVILITLQDILVAKAQNNSTQISNLYINGLFSPTAAERFFEEGREDFAKEIDLLSDPDILLKEDLLYINPEVRNKIYQLQPFFDSEPDNTQINDNY